MSVKVELVKIRTTLELSGGKFSRQPENILSTASSSLGAMSWPQRVKCETETVTLRPLDNDYWVENFAN